MGRGAVPRAQEKEHGVPQAALRPARSLRSHLLRLALVMLLPALLLGGWLTAQLTARLKADAEELLAAGARARALAVERELEAAVLLLTALGTSPYLDQGSEGFAAFHAQAREVVAPLDSFAIFVRRAEPRRQVVNSRLPLGTPLPSMLEDGPTAEVLRTGRPAFRAPQVLPLIEQRLASVAVPVRRGGELVGALAMPIQPDRLGALLRQPVGRFGSVAFIVANSGLQVVRLELREGMRVPAELPAGFLEATADRQRGVIRRPDASGEPLLIAFERVPVNGWLVALVA